MGECCPGTLPRNEPQVSDYKHCATVGSLSKVKGNDCYTVMLVAHSEDSNCQFVRDIKAYPEPSHQFLLVLISYLMMLSSFVHQHMSILFLLLTMLFAWVIVMYHSQYTAILWLSIDV